jgi:hypothetical protein
MRAPQVQHPEFLTIQVVGIYPTEEQCALIHDLGKVWSVLHGDTVVEKVGPVPLLPPLWGLRACLSFCLPVSLFAWLAGWLTAFLLLLLQVRFNYPAAGFLEDEALCTKMKTLKLFRELKQFLSGVMAPPVSAAAPASVATPSSAAAKVRRPCCMRQCVRACAGSVLLVQRVRRWLLFAGAACEAPALCCWCRPAAAASVNTSCGAAAS